MFSVALAEGGDVLRTPAPNLVFVVFGKFFSQFAKRNRELAEDNAEKKILHNFRKNIRPHDSNLIIKNLASYVSRR